MIGRISTVKRLLIKLTFTVVCLTFIHALDNVSLAQSGDKAIQLTDEARRTRDVSLAVLDEMKEIIEEHYYDTKYHNIDLKARIAIAKERIRTLQYNWQMYRVLAQFLLEFDDSHTNLIIPPRPDHYDFGFDMQMIGDKCLVTSVKRDGGGRAAGLEAGDQVLMIRNFAPSRADLWKMLYVIYKLDPIDKLELKVRKTSGEESTVVVKATTMTEKEFKEKRKQRKEQKINEGYKCQELDGSAIACKLLTFDVEPDVVDRMMKVVAKYPKLLLDLRGNGGGLVITEQRLLSYFFDHEVKILDMVRRNKTEIRKTKSLGEKHYKGEVAVLTDSRTGSAAEITARVLQIEKRAKIYGDVSAGAVMTSIAVFFQKVFDKFKYRYFVKLGMSITINDVVMSDGSRLEKVGVLPDQLVRPTATGMAQNKDGVLAYAAAKLGVNITAEKAGSFGFFAPESDDDGLDAEE